MRFLLIAGVIALTLTSGAASAAQDDCLSHALTQHAIDACVSKSTKASDRKLNETYRALLAKVGKDGGEPLRAAQRAWLAWRDAQCRFNTMSTQGGSVDSTAYAICVDDLTQEQTKRLDAQLHCEEGDVSCGGR